MTDPKAAEPIIELVDVIDWRFVILALVAGAAITFVVLAMIEHTPDAGPVIGGEE